MRFEQPIDSIDQLRAILGEPSDLVIRKDIGILDAHARAFLERSPFVLVGTAGLDGRCDVSPRGGPPGGVCVLDEMTLALPEWPGNRRADTLGNILANPRVGLLFLAPGVDETLRVNGRARIVQDDWLRDRLANAGRRPRLAIIVEAEEVFFHCAKAFRRSRLWDPAAQIDRRALPSLAKILTDQLQIEDCPLDELEARVERGYQTTLY
ncbi:MAG: pyridoxamine 5'-phosphate oxidase family protein [Dehalococcoidia bacterium]